MKGLILKETVSKCESWHTPEAALYDKGRDEIEIIESTLSSTADQFVALDYL